MSAAKPKHNPPQGMEPFDLGGEGDLGALSEEQQIKLNKFKIETRLANEKYLRGHPEVECLISLYLRQLCIQQPDNVREFSAEFFTDANLQIRVDEVLQSREDEMKQNRVLQKIV